MFWGGGCLPCVLESVYDDHLDHGDEEAEDRDPSEHDEHGRVRGRAVRRLLKVHVHVPNIVMYFLTFGLFKQ